MTGGTFVCPGCETRSGREAAFCAKCGEDLQLAQRIAAHAREKWMAFRDRCQEQNASAPVRQLHGSNALVGSPYSIQRINTRTGMLGPAIGKAKRFDRAVAAAYYQAQVNRTVHFHNYTRPPEVDQYPSIALLERGDFILAFEMNPRDAALIGFSTHMLPELAERIRVAIDAVIAARQ